jgi:hypothetical protein
MMRMLIGTMLATLAAMTGMVAVADLRESLGQRWPARFVAKLKELEITAASQ